MPGAMAEGPDAAVFAAKIHINQTLPNLRQAGFSYTMDNVRPVNYGLIALLALLQYPLWIGGGGYTNVWQLRHEIGARKQENHQLRERNRSQAAEVVNLQQGLDAIEERARTELGMVKKGETFFQVIETPIR